MKKSTLKKTTLSNIKKAQIIDQLTLKNIKGGINCPPPFGGFDN